MSISAASRPLLSAALIRRRSRRPLLLAPPSAYGPAPVVDASAPAIGRANDLRFFATCYVAGFVFFLIMLS